MTGDVWFGGCVRDRQHGKTHLLSSCLVLVNDFLLTPLSRRSRAIEERANL